MAWNFHNKEPIYMQIMDEIKLRIAQGTLKPGDKVPPVRELALKAGVNPNTMQKALSELERSGVLYSQRTSGRFVAEPEQSGMDMRDEIGKRHSATYVKEMRELGYGNDLITATLAKYLEEEGKYEQFS